MQTTVDRMDLKNAVNAARRASLPKKKLPVLADVRLTTHGDTLTAACTDLSVSAIVTMDADLVTTPGVAAVDAALLAKLLHGLTGVKAVTLELEDDVLALTADDGTRIELATLPPDDFPALPDEVDGAKLGAGLCYLTENITPTLELCEAFTSAEESRFQLNGCLLHAPDRMPTWAATDGYRLFRDRPPCEEHSEAETAILCGDKGAIIPRDALKVFRMAKRHHGGRTRVRTIEPSGDFVVLESGNLRVLTRKLEGTFPDVERVIAGTTGDPHAVDPESLRQAADVLDRLTKGTRARAMALTAEAGTLTAVGYDPDGARISRPVEANVNGHTYRVGLNPGYIADALPKWAERVTMAVHDENCAVRIDYADRPEAVSVIMPMRV